MLKRTTTTTEEVRLCLVSDPAVQAAQIRAARARLDAEIGSAEPTDLSEMILAAVRSTAASHAEVVEALAALSEVGQAALADVLTQEQSTEAFSRLRAALDDEDVRHQMAYVRAWASWSRYAGSSDLADLEDPDPPDATWVSVRALTRQEERDARDAAGVPPPLGALHAGRVADVARKASRTGEDHELAAARYLDSLTPRESEALRTYEDWCSRHDRETVARGLVSVDGWEDLAIEGGRYPVERLERTTPLGSGLVAEVAGHIRRVGTLGKEESWRGSSSLGTHAPASGHGQAAAGGHAASASETGP